MRRIEHSHTAIVRNLARRALLLCGVVVALVACSPAYNWRTLNLDSVGAQAFMPCKPEYSTRDIPLLDGASTVKLHMQACDVGDATFAVSWLNVPQGQAAPAALQRWLAASLAGAQVGDAPLVSNWSVKGALPAKRYSAQGRRHDGQAIAVDIGMAQRGPSVVQLAIYGGKPTQRERLEFWQNLAWQP
jgi:hypothetical protein